MLYKTHITNRRRKNENEEMGKDKKHENLNS